MRGVAGCASGNYDMKMLTMTKRKRAEIAARLIALRAKLGMTQEQAADLLRTSRGTLACWEAKWRDIDDAHEVLLGMAEQGQLEPA
jgi:DNA-binding transcriptional regulator YiaG